MSLLDSIYTPPAYNNNNEVNELEAALQEAYEAGLSDGYNEALNETSLGLKLHAADKAAERANLAYKQITNPHTSRPRRAALGAYASKKSDQSLRFIQKAREHLNKHKN